MIILKRKICITFQFKFQLVLSFWRDYFAYFVYLTVINDYVFTLGVGFAHLQTDGRAIVAAALKLGLRKISIMQSLFVT